MPDSVRPRVRRYLRGGLDRRHRAPSSPRSPPTRASHEIGGWVYDGLVRLDKNLNNVPASWRSPGRSVRTASRSSFKLRRDVKWHDGRAVHRRGRGLHLEGHRSIPRRPAPFKEKFLQIQERRGPRLVHRAGDPSPEPYARSVESSGRSTSCPSTGLEPGCGRRQARANRPRTEQPIGTGAYRFKEWRSGEKVVLLANPDYYLGKPYLSRIVYRVIPEPGDDLPRAEGPRRGLFPRG